MSERKPGGAGSVVFDKTARKMVGVTPKDLVSVSYLNPTQKLPLVVSARSTGLDLKGWIQGNADIVKRELLIHGAILFRGFQIGAPDHFRRLVQTLFNDPIAYRERSSPRSQVVQNIYTSTDHPEDQSIFPHNELSYSITFPKKLFFWCQTAPKSGGETPLGDTRDIFMKLDRSLIAKFLDKGWMYVRNYGAHFGLPWHTAFQTTDKAEIEEYCRKSDIEWEWLPDGLRTWQVRPAVIQHPDTGQIAWFNHAAFFHISSVTHALRTMLQAEYDEQDYPYNTYYGDGSKIEDEVIQHLRDTYESQMVWSPWEYDDLLLIDNISVAHARRPYSGPRKILFAMAEPFTRPTHCSN